VSPRSSFSYVGTQRPGDVWDWTLGSSTFSATDTTLGTGYSGTASVLPAGFYKLTVNASTDSTAPIASSAYALAVPGVAMIVQPAGTVTNPIVCAGLGSNPTGTSSYNWIDIPQAGWANTDAAYGTATLAMSSDNTGNLSLSSNTLLGASIGSSMESITCTDGQFTTGASTGLITPSGVIMIDNGPSNGGLFGVLAPSTDVDLTNVAADSFRGIMFKGGSGSGGTSLLLELAPNGSGQLTGTFYTDVDTNTLDTDPDQQATVAFSTQSSPGLVIGTVSGAGTPQSFVFSINQVGGKYMLYGFCQEADGNVDNILLMQYP
jgi:hypothetical protein